VYEVRELAEVKHFCNHKLGISERQMGTVTWPEVAHRLVQVRLAGKKGRRWGGQQAP
jgi:autophagy-related protein 9